MKTTIRTSIDLNISDVFTADVTLRFDEIKEFFENCSHEQKLELRSALKLTDFASYGKTIIDNMKLELTHEAMHKYSLDELEARLK